uniref:Uncharacterized protein n=1 Tax=Arundo donax TaxID=35708 RepID=A0A0A9GI23_ARUDO
MGISSSIFVLVLYIIIIIMGAMFCSRREGKG